MTTLERIALLYLKKVEEAAEKHRFIHSLSEDNSPSIEKKIDIRFPEALMDRKGRP